MIASQEPGLNRSAALGLMPASATADARTLLVTRALRGFADGAVSVLLADYLSLIGLSPLQIGAIITGTLLGSAALTLAFGLLGHRLGLRRLLLAASALMFATGLGFLGVTAFWPLFVVAVAGTLNPSAGDVSVFLPAEQAALSGTVEGRDRTGLFARYNLSGNLAGALGALASGLPVAAARRFGWEREAAERSGFALYAAVALAVGILYWKLSPALDQHAGTAKASPPRRSRRIVFRLAALFSLDSEEHLERAAIAFVRELGLEHVEAQLARLGRVALAAHEREARLRIEEAPDEPRAGDAVDVDVLASDPGTAAYRGGQHRLLMLHRRFACAAFEARFELTHEPLDRDAAGGREEVDRRDLAELLLEARDLTRELGAALFGDASAPRKGLLSGAYLLGQGLVVGVPG